MRPEVLRNERAQEDLLFFKKLIKRLMLLVEGALKIPHTSLAVSY